MIDHGEHGGWRRKTNLIEATIYSQQKKGIVQGEPIIYTKTLNLDRAP
jgi:hypothetical protein